jgi:hypothetical protein
MLGYGYRLAQPTNKVFLIIEIVMRTVYRFIVFPLICLISKCLPPLIFAYRTIHEECVKPFRESVTPQNWRFVNLNVALIVGRIFMQFRLNIARRMTKKISDFMGSMWGSIMLIRGSRVYA